MDGQNVENTGKLENHRADDLQVGHNLYENAMCNSDITLASFVVVVVLRF